MTYTITYKGNSDVKSGRIGSFTLPDGKTINYRYDNFNRLTSKTLGLTASYGIVEYYDYWTNGNKTADLVTTYSVLVPGGVRTYYNYTYDDYGNILTVKEGTTLKISYTYDELNQLTRENNAYTNKTYVYTYDKNGNILTKKTYAYTTGTLGTPESIENYTYGDSSWKDLLTNYNGTDISYDEIGNPTNWTGNITELTWYGKQLSSLKKGSSTYSYTYNSDGIRTQKSLVTDGASLKLTTHYVLDGSKIVAQYQTSTSSSNAQNVIYFYYDESGAPIGLKYDGKQYYFQKNLQGDIVAIYQNFSKVATYTYDAWGNIIASTDTSDVSIGTKNPFRYRGYYYDTDTGLYYLNSRYYDPQVGRFISADGFVSTGQGLLGSNMFAYCGNNPVNYRDTSGMMMTSALQKDRDMASAGGSSDGLAGIFLGLGLLLTKMWNSIRNSFTGTLSPPTLAKPQIKDEAKAEESIKDSSISKPPQMYHAHHIVAQGDHRARPAQDILETAKIDRFNDPANLVLLPAYYHRRIHTNAYYEYVNEVITTAYEAGGTEGVYSALAVLKWEIYTGAIW